MDLPVLQIIKRIGDGGGDALDGTGGGEDRAAGKADGRDGRLLPKGLVQLGRCIGMGVAHGGALGSEQGGEIGVIKAAIVIGAAGGEQVRQVPVGGHFVLAVVEIEVSAFQPGDELAPGYTYFSKAKRSCTIHGKEIAVSEWRC